MFKSIAVVIAFLILSACSSIPSASPKAMAAAKMEGDASEGVSNKLAREASFFSPRLARQVKYYAYLPPSYGVQTRKKYPVLYWLHGSAGYPPGFVEMLATRFDRAIRQGKIPELIVIFPDGFANTMWVNSFDGKTPVEDALVHDLIPTIDKHFRTRADRAARMLEGGSMGGYGAARLGLRYPNLFGTVSMINPGPMQPRLDPDNAPVAGRQRAARTLATVYGDSVDFFEKQSPWKLAEAFARQSEFDLQMRLIVGELDPSMPTNMRFSKHLTELGIDHEVIVIPQAGHDRRAMFSGLGDDYWAFFSDRLESREGSTDPSIAGQ